MNKHEAKIYTRQEIRTALAEVFGNMPMLGMNADCMKAAKELLDSYADRIYDGYGTETDISLLDDPEYEHISSHDGRGECR